MTEILRFEMNVPAKVALKYASPGKPIEGRYGNRIMYILADDRVMYVAPIVANRITDLGVQPGELFQVRKRLKKQGQRRLIEWDVQRIASEPETRLEQELRQSIEATQVAKAVQLTENGGPSLQLPPPTQEQIPLPSNSKEESAVNPAKTDSTHRAAQDRNRIPPVITKPGAALEKATSMVDGVGIDLGSTQQRVVPPLPATPAVIPIENGSADRSSLSVPKNGNNSPPVTTKLEHALKTAISAASNAEKYGAELGYVVRFDADAIKSMAITVLINMSEGGRR